MVNNFTKYQLSVQSPLTSKGFHSFHLCIKACPIHKLVKLVLRSSQVTFDLYHKLQSLSHTYWLFSLVIPTFSPLNQVATG